MKGRILGVILLLAMSVAEAFCQDSLSVRKPARLYLLKTGSPVHTIQLFTLQAPDTPIRISNQSFAELQLEVDSLGLLQGRSFADSPYSAKALQRKPIYLVFKPGMDYYFRVNGNQASQPIEIQEVSANSFWLYVLVNELDNQGKRYRVTPKDGILTLTP